jgi:hypothetical protein
MLCFVQFIHPGKEHEPDHPEGRSWNVKSHRRKFLVDRGRYLDEDGIKEGEICFWGEWEPDSEVREHIKEPVVDGPHYLHGPYYKPITSPGRWQNTDPFVFGDRFLYTCCKQHAGGHPTQLKYLDRGSVILFGSCVDRSRFVVDTVFVVDNAIEYDLRNYADRIPKSIGETYTHVTVLRLDDSLSYKLYFGASYDTPADGMFSFFPCLPYQSGTNGFARPRIQIPVIVTDNLTQGYRLNPGGSIDTVKNLWATVVDQVVSQGLNLGLWAEMPPSRSLDSRAEAYTGRGGHVCR